MRFTSYVDELLKEYLIASIDTIRVSSDNGHPDTWETYIERPMDTYVIFNQDEIPVIRSVAFYSSGTLVAYQYNLSITPEPEILITLE